jgi:hypothetical protein
VPKIPRVSILPLLLATAASKVKVPMLAVQNVPHVKLVKQELD